jgi:hypothetical protein
MSSILRPVWSPLISPIAAAVTAARRNGAGPVLPAFDYLVLLGSSTTFQAFWLNPVLGRQEQSARLSMTQAGYDVPIISKAVEGSTIANLDTNINTYLTELGPISAADKSRVAVVVNIGSNDIGATAYGAMAQGTKDAMLAGLNSIITKIAAFGFTPILATVHSRKTFEAMYEEWADLMFRPLVDSRTPYWKDGALAVFDYCRLYLDNKNVVNWWNADNVHPWMATVPMQQYTAQKLGSKANLPAASAVQRALIYFPSTFTYPGGLNAISPGATGTTSTIYDANGAIIAGASFSWSGATGSSGSVRANPGVFDVSLAHSAVQSAMLYSSAATITFTAAFGAAFANRTGVLRVTGSSSTAGRLTNITAGANSAVLNASGPGVQIVEIPFAMDAAGTLVFTAAPQSPSTFANVSGVELIFN